MAHFTALFLLLAVLRCSAGFMLLQSPDKCEEFHNIQLVDLSDESCDEMGGRTDNDKCWLCLFEVSKEKGKYYENVWGIHEDQSLASRSRHLTIYVDMHPEECFKLGGYQGYGSKATPGDIITCEVALKRMSGTYNDLTSLVFCKLGTCYNKISSAEVWATPEKCVQLGNSLRTKLDPHISCSFGIGMSPAINCTPTDNWTTLVTCSNNQSSVPFDCKFQRKVGSSKKISHTTKKEADLEVSLEEKFSLQEIFASEDTTLGIKTGFKWEKSHERSELWTKADSYTMEVTVPPGQVIVFEQIVGNCGAYSVHTPDIRMKQIDF